MNRPTGTPTARWTVGGHALAAGFMILALRMEASATPLPPTPIEHKIRDAQFILIGESLGVRYLDEYGREFAAPPPPDAGQCCTPRRRPPTNVEITVRVHEVFGASPLPNEYLSFVGTYGMPEPMEVTPNTVQCGEKREWRHVPDRQLVRIQCGNWSWLRDPAVMQTRRLYLVTRSGPWKFRRVPGLWDYVETALPVLVLIGGPVLLIVGIAAWAGGGLWPPSSDRQHRFPPYPP